MCLPLDCSRGNSRTTAPAAEIDQCAALLHLFVGFPLFFFFFLALASA